MATSNQVAQAESEPKRTLGLTGVTINAMALIAPGAFLWITFQLQAAQSGPDGSTTGFDMWQGIFFALVIAFLTAISYSEMAKLYPDAGYGSAYYFAEKTFIDKEDTRHHRWARASKLVTGWAAHLFYWVYPGVMVTFMAILVSYIAGLFGATDGNGNPGLPLSVDILVAVGFAVLVGLIAVRGINGSTLTNLIINIVQLTSLVVFSALAIIYRLRNPDGATFGMLSDGTQVGHTTAGSIFIPHSLTGVLFQSTIAILILVGFESCTALGAEAKNPRHSVPRGVLLSLIIQGLFAYLIGYFAANFALSDKLVYQGTDASGAAVTYTGIAAAAHSQAPVGDMMRLFGDSLLGGVGFGLTVTMAITVALAILGTTLSCVNTAVRVSYAMAKDEEMPEIIGLMHGKYATPSAATWILIGFSAIIGAIGVYSVVTQTGLGIASNLGTFILYALICVWTIIAFAGRPNRNVLLHVIIPALGLIMNLVMVITIFYLAFAAGGDSSKEGFIALGVALVWGVISALYIGINAARKRRVLVPTT
ncbi:MAG TPA: APC family permease [Roseiflexaceae bacterium]|nr:APC family permease [Roseiflexaceae bacterium]